jgi:hypothetical protein
MALTVMILYPSSGAAGAEFQIPGVGFDVGGEPGTHLFYVWGRLDGSPAEVAGVDRFETDLLDQATGGPAAGFMPPAEIIDPRAPGYKRMWAIRVYRNLNGAGLPAKLVFKVRVKAVSGGGAVLASDEASYLKLVAS